MHVSASITGCIVTWTKRIARRHSSLRPFCICTKTRFQRNHTDCTQFTVCSLIINYPNASNKSFLRPWFMPKVLLTKAHLQNSKYYSITNGMAQTIFHQFFHSRNSCLCAGQLRTREHHKLYANDVFREFTVHIQYTYTHTVRVTFTYHNEI